MNISVPSHGTRYTSFSSVSTLSLEIAMIWTCTDENRRKTIIFPVAVNREFVTGSWQNVVSSRCGRNGPTKSRLMVHVVRNKWLFVISFGTTHRHCYSWPWSISAENLTLIWPKLLISSTLQFFLAHSKISISESRKANLSPKTHNLKFQFIKHFYYAMTLIMFDKFFMKEMRESNIHMCRNLILLVKDISVGIIGLAAT